MSSQCPLQTEASSSQAAEMVKITGLDISAPLQEAARGQTSSQTLSSRRPLTMTLRWYLLSHSEAGTSYDARCKGTPRNKILDKRHAARVTFGHPPTTASSPMNSRLRPLG